MTEPRSFDVCGPLPTGVTVLEASAGTGKTYTIAALAARYVAAGLRLDELLLVTFTRMATGELRERVRERLGQAEQALARRLAGEPCGGDRVDELLAGGTPEEVVLRRERLVRALADFDAATITTTHGFCLEALSGLGIVGDVERGSTVTEDASGLLEEVVDDLYVRRFHGADGEPPFKRAQAMEIVRMAVDNMKAPLLPVVDRSDPSVIAMRSRLAAVAREELDRRKRRGGILTYDDLLWRLDGTLAGADGAWAARRLRARFRVVLVDEFQDTDPVQWQIVRRAFADGAEEDRALVLIGDPKQAIYAFRGADVHAYLAAAREAGKQETLGTNWRSDQGLISALDAMFGGARLGHDDIVYRRVSAVEAHREPRLHGAPVDLPLRVRVVHRHDPTVRTTNKGFARTEEARQHVADDVAAQIVALLSSGAELEDRGTGAGGPRRRVEPGDLAVLVRTHKQASIVHEALRMAGVPSVINGAGSVFGSQPAHEWLRLLQALERPTSAPRARTAVLTCFFGWTPQQVAEAGEEAWEAVHRRLHGWARVLRTRGVASLLEVMTASERLPERVLAQVEGERLLTDLRHVAQLMHAAATAERLGVTALASWLRARVDAAASESGDEERSRRLESDADAVQVLTIHRSKGLEFPVVLCPFLWDFPGKAKGEHPVAFHESGERRIDVALAGTEYELHKRTATQEERGEDLRLAYVALTRARHQAVLWWAGTFPSRLSPLSRLAFARDENGHVALETDVPSDEVAMERFTALARAAADCVAVERSELAATRASWEPAAREERPLRAAAFDRPIDRRWRRASYSSITAATYDARVGSEPEGRVVDDEVEAGVPADVAGDDRDEALRAVPSVLDEMPAGTHFGTFVHEVLESADFAAADLDAELRDRVDRRLARRPVEVGERDTVIAGLRAMLQTPLGPDAGDLRLCDVARADRLDELEFELPLAGGDVPSGALDLDAIAGLLRAHTPEGAPLHGYAERLGDERLQRDLRGYLTGSIDLVLRLPDGRFAIVDYKTNRLGAPGLPVSAWDFRPSALDEAMQHSHYGLQALLYTAALHRYLRWRLTGYDPDEHLAGVRYLFVRGMTGAGTPVAGGQRCGVFAWEPSGALVSAVSDVLDRGSAA